MRESDAVTQTPLCSVDLARRTLQCCLLESKNGMNSFARLRRCTFYVRRAKDIAKLKLTRTAMSASKKFETFAGDCESYQPVCSYSRRQKLCQRPSSVLKGTD